MDAFDRLTPALQYQIVNTLGWKELRPVQEESIHAVLDGDNCVILAPTAGGKTEAAFFPLLSMMDAEDPPPTSVLYIAPIRALLNNQDARLEVLTGMLGRRTMKWHGDVGASRRKRFVREPADVLAITPESLEAMLMSTRTPGKELLSRVRAVVIDEIHAFASDDRGAHLVALLERIARLSRHDIQRIGLSATVGDPDVICDWLSGSSSRGRKVVDPGGGQRNAEVHLDYVGSMANAAVMVDRLYPGTRRLVFVDSRRGVEELGDYLGQRGVNVFVSHSSLAARDRHAAERAFEEGDNCVIVATSALELGIDVGDLDHVFQVDAPTTVSSFLQRMGRTGRRAGTRANCTFLATTDDAVLRAAALVRLYREGYVEPSAPSFRAPHILAQQLLGMALEHNGVPRASWWGHLEGCAAFRELDESDREAITAHMVSEEILVEVDGRWILGPRGEKLYGFKNFMELFAVFSTPAILRVMHGPTEIGTIDAWFAQQQDEGPFRFVLGNRAWEMESVNWKASTCQVRPSDSGAYPRWTGRPVLLSRTLCQAMHAVLVDDATDSSLSARATETIVRLRAAHDFLLDDHMPIVEEPKRTRWWTFGGGAGNTLLARMLESRLGEAVASNNLCLTFTGNACRSRVAIQEAIDSLLADDALSPETAAAFAPTEGTRRVSKFEPCLPERLSLEVVAQHLLDVEAAGMTLSNGQDHSGA